MAAGEFPKVDGDVLYSSEVNKFNAVQSLQASMGLIVLEVAKDGLNYINESNIKANNCYYGLGIANINTATSTPVEDETSIYLSESLDECNNVTIDDTIWTYLDVTADVNTIRVLAGFNKPAISWLETNGTTGFNCKVANQDVEVRFGLSTYDVGNGVIKIQITDGTHTIDVVTLGDIGKSVHKLRFDYSANNVQYDSAAAVDISSVTGNWYIKFICTSSTAEGNWAELQLYWIRFRKESSSGVPIVYSNTLTTGTVISGVNLIIKTWNTDLNVTNGKLIFYASADNGSNYELITPKIHHSFTNTGTQFILKIIDDSNIVNASYTTSVPTLEGWTVFLDTGD